jgi:predicted small lipoprotein YifL
MMKKLHILIFILAVAAVAACGVKSNLEHPNKDYPRSYPTK